MTANTTGEIRNAHSPRLSMVRSAGRTPMMRTVSTPAAAAGSNHSDRRSRLGSAEAGSLAAAGVSETDVVNYFSVQNGPSASASRSVLRKQRMASSGVQTMGSSLSLNDVLVSMGTPVSSWNRLINR